MPEEMEREFLRRLADTAPNATLRELAAEILAGRIRWSEAARSQAYGEALAQVIAPVVEDPELLSPEAIADWREDASRLSEVR